MKFKGIILVLAVFLIAGMGSCKKSVPQNTVKVFKGYLMDVACGNADTALDKTKPKEAPQDHTVHCLNACIATGYGIMTKDKGDKAYKFTKFNDNGSLLSIAILKATAKDKAISIEVTGKLEAEVIEVDSIKEIDQM